MYGQGAKGRRPLMGKSKYPSLFHNFKRLGKSTPHIGWEQFKFLNKVYLLLTQFPFLEASKITSLTRNVLLKSIYCAPTIY